MVRYIDDFVLCFQYRADALRAQEPLVKRLGKFSLTLEPKKTKLVEFGRFAYRHANKRGRKRPETIYFLGFTLYCTRNRKGNFRIGVRTEKTRLRRALMRLQDQMRQMRHLSLQEQVNHLNPMLRGHYAYYGIGRKYSCVATGASGCGALLAQNVEQSEPAWHDVLDALSADQGTVSSAATQAVSPQLGATSDRRTVKQLLRSVVREIRTLRSVGAGGG
jgi:RNase P protein component